MNDILKNLLPTAATMLGGPLAGFAVKFLAEKLGVSEATQETVTQALNSLAGNPEERLKLATMDAELRIKAIDAGIELDKLAVQNAGDINKTMQAEAAADHWPTYSWRPFIGFMFGAYIASLWVLPLAGKSPAVLAPDVVLTIGAILGVASFFRGKAQADPRIPTDNRG